MPASSPLLRARHRAAALGVVVAFACAPAAFAAQYQDVPEPKETKAEALKRKAGGLARSLAKGVDGTDRASVRRGVTVKVSLQSGRASFKLQVRTGESWATVVAARADKGRKTFVLKPGATGVKRLRAASVVDGKITARYAVTLTDGKIKATATRGLYLRP